MGFPSFPDMPLSPLAPASSPQNPSIACTRGSRYVPKYPDVVEIDACPTLFRTIYSPTGVRPGLPFQQQRSTTHRPRIGAEG